MKVNSINNNVYQKQSFNTPPTFRGKGLDPEIWNYLQKRSGRVSRFLNFVGENQGEALNIIVTAVGTAIICPLFIAFNPLSKEDDKTKQYSAWRQPISAVIALATQLTITKWFNDWINKAASTSTKDGKPGLSSRADLRACPTERHLKSIIKREHPEYDKKRIAEEIKKRQIDAEKAEIDRMRNVMKYKPDGKQIEYKELVCQDYIEKAKKQFFDEFKTVNKEEIEKKFGKPIDDIWSLKLNKHLEKMLDNKAKSMGKDTQTMLSEAAEKLIEKDVTSEAVSKSIVRFFNKKNANVQKAIDTCTPENITQMIKDLGLENKFPDGINAEEIAHDIKAKLDHIKDWETHKQMEDFKSVKNLGKTYEEILHNVKVKRLVKSRVSDAKRVLKTMNTQMGLVVTLATLPFTCGFLNWCYPRIMEKIMPEMSAKKKNLEEKISNFNAKIEQAVDSLNLDGLKEVVNIEEFKNFLKDELEKGGDD